MEEGEKRDREEKKRKRGERFGGGGGSNGELMVPGRMFRREI